VELRSRLISRLTARRGPRTKPGVPAALAAAGLALTLALLLAPAPAAADVPELETPPTQDEPPTGYALSADEVTRIARQTAAVRSERREHPDLDPTAYTNGPGRWQVSWLVDGDEVAQVHVADPTGAVLEEWTGPQVAWRMARGYDGAFGRHVNAPYIWLPLCVLFLVPFVDPRRPLRIVHLDLLVMLAFGASHIFFNRGEISLSVPLVYPVLVYLLGRMLWVGFRPRERRERLVPLIPRMALALGVIFLVGFRVALNVADSNVIDVGYAGVIGADQIADGDGLYGAFPEDIEHGDTYGPVTYLSYVPFEQAISWSGEWDALPAAHGAAIAFDLLTMLGLFLLGLRLRRGEEGKTLGVALAFAWASYPYTTYALSSNTNDSLVAMLVVFALLAVSSAPGRGALLGLATAAKFAPLALVPLFASGTGRLRDMRSLALFALAFAAAIAATVMPLLPDGGLGEMYERTVAYQASRDSPFSVWGQAESLGWLQTALQVGALGLAVAVAFVPRRRSPAQVAALGAAVLLALQLVVTHWFYLYVVWFAPLAFVAFFAFYRGHAEQRPEPERGRHEEARAPAPPEPVPA
jgi:hypothetical protein